MGKNIALIALLLCFNIPLLAQQNLPYPIIFIHGLNSNSKAWEVMKNSLTNYGLSYGGRIDFCLNYDGDNSTSNKNIYPTLGADIRQYPTTLTPLSVADFYLLNFDINNSGDLFPSDDGIPFNDILSNESAIAKQGVALKYAVLKVLQITNKSKVILMGHSMGGLAAREYVQNQSNWQSDGNHHIAKLVTTGTPHGGFNGIDLSPTIDFRSEAYRDLVTPYTISGYSGVYLFGGVENYSVINNNALYDFYNVDVNCNGIDADNTYIVGLNQRQWITDLDYSYIVGICTNCAQLQGTIQGDGVVRSVNANLSNFTTQLLTPKNEYIYQAAASTPLGLHSDLPEAVNINMRALDEPNEYSIAYGIELNQRYKGFITMQPTNGYRYDYDDYKITIQQTGTLNVKLYNIPVSKCYFNLLNSSQTSIYLDSTNGQGYNEFNRIVTPGTYYIEFYAIPENTTWFQPYEFKVSVLCQTAEISITGNTTTCSTSLPVLTSNSSTGNQWYLNNVVISGATSNTYTPSFSGIYTLVTTVNGCVSNPSNPVTVTVYQPPTASVTPSGVLQVCSGDSATLTANSGTGLTYQWKKNGANIDGAISSTYIATQAGVYSVLITNGNGCNSLSNSTTIVVNPIITPMVNISVSPVGSVSYGTQVVFTAHASNGGSSPIFQWYKNNLLISGVTDSVYSSSILSESDSIKCILVSNASCVSTTNAISNTIVCSRFNLYTFLGNGNWDADSNWSFRKIPPGLLKAGDRIIIDPQPGGECILNTQQYFKPGALLNIEAGKVLRIPGKIDIYDSTACLPSINTAAVSSISTSAAISGGIINSQGCLDILSKGVVWSTSPNPTINLSTKTVDGTGSANFSSTMSSLAPYTTYYVRAYVTNPFGTAYGNQLMFTTQASQLPSVVIGSQVWTSKNLDVATYRNGDPIPQVTNPTEWANLTTGAWCWYNNDSVSYSRFGRLYNWYAVNDPRGLAPAGWHVPTQSEWETLSTYLGGPYQAGNAMKLSSDWDNYGGNNSSGFRALPSGYRTYNGSFTSILYSTGFWTSTEIAALIASHYYLIRDTNSPLNNSNEFKQYGFSVRCIRD